MSMAVSKAVMGATFDDMVENAGKCWGCTVTTAVERLDGWSSKHQASLVKLFHVLRRPSWLGPAWNKFSHD